MTTDCKGLVAMEKYHEMGNGKYFRVNMLKEQGSWRPNIGYAAGNLELAESRTFRAAIE